MYRVEKSSVPRSHIAAEVSRNVKCYQFLSILSTEPNWLYWADRADAADSAENARIAFVYAVFRAD
jgi:hypothetical protein